MSFLVGLLLFGLEAHADWFEGLSQSDRWVWLHINASIWGLITRGGTDNLLYEPLTEANMGSLRLVWLALCVPLGLLTLTVAAYDHSPHAVDRGFALVLLAAVLCSPLGWTYYFWLPLGPAFAVAVSWRRAPAGAWPGRSAPTCWRKGLLTVVALGWFCPVHGTLLLQESPLGTVTLGSLYMWAALSAWLVFLLDGWRHVRLFARPGRALDGVSVVPAS